MLIKVTYKRYIQYDTIYGTFKSMQNNYFILFRDIYVYIYEKETDTWE